MQFNNLLTAPPWYFRADLKSGPWNAFFLILDKNILALPDDRHLIETRDVTFFALHTPCHVYALEPQSQSASNQIRPSGNRAPFNFPRFSQKHRHQSPCSCSHHCQLSSLNQRVPLPCQINGT